MNRLASLKGNTAWASLDVATSVWKHRDRLRDPSQRTEASKAVAWDVGESVVKTAASSGGAAAAGVALAAAAEGSFVFGTAIAGSTVVVAAAPFVAGASAAYATGKLVTIVRIRVGPS
jgi:hypothetical protein